MGILSVEELSINFGGLVAVDHVSFEVKRGEILSIIGPNGSGKTTIFNLISGIYKPTTGKILFKDKLINGMKPHNVAFMGIARTFQNVRLFKQMTVLENVLVGHHPKVKSLFIDDLFHTSKQRKEEVMIREQAIKLLDLFHLKQYIDEKAENLPYGDQRRLEIVRALASEPEIMLLDEPAAGMNPQETEDLIRLIGQIKDLGITIVLVEHDMKVVMDISQRIIVLDYGKKIAEGVPEEIRKNERVIEAYLGKD